ncbi:MAG: hypothetical protein KGI35_12185 [Burkholderiales bacterium]|nr:hypothetical protein [Burkholderiales bacterium]
MRTHLEAGGLAALALSCLAAASPALAGPADYVSTPIVEQGEREIDFKAGTAKLPDGTRASAQSVGLGLGVNSWWFTEAYAKWQHTPGDRNRFDAWEWENRFQLTETGKYPVDLGFLLEIERPKDRSEGYEYRWGPLLQADLTPKLQGNLNLLFEKHIRASEPSAAELGYQWQLKYRWQPSLEFGAQGFGDVGPWDDPEPKSQQPHIAGPAIFGRIGLGGRQAIKYNAGLLFGLTDGAPRQTLRLQAEFEF